MLLAQPTVVWAGSSEGKLDATRSSCAQRWIKAASVPSIDCDVYRNGGTRTAELGRCGRAIRICSVKN